MAAELALAGRIPSPPLVLPALRDELRLIAANDQGDGSPSWHILDPVRNRFFRIGWLEFELLTRWSLGRPDAILDSVRSETPLEVTREDLAHLGDFLHRHQLVRQGSGAILALAAQKDGLWHWLLHHYLFFRLPLVNPQAVLPGLADRLSWMFSRPFLFATAVAAVVGVAGIARHWDWARVQWQASLTGDGLLLYAIALVVAKAAHEMGHALVATRHGVRVGHMGVAMVVLFPMLYTDTAETWKLERSAHRLRIAIAGVGAELAIAAWATLVWWLFPETPLGRMAFFLATTSWWLSLVINLSPFLRFDGYYALADWLNIPSLHERAQALARTRLRRRLFGLDLPDPEHFSNARAHGLVAFAYLTWLYRAVLFFGIALLVYSYFFKALGIFLFLVEIHWFILRPIHFEMKHWPPLWRAASTRRRFVLMGLAVSLPGLLMLPLDTHERASGWVYQTQQRQIFSPEAARLVEWRGVPGQDFRKGQLIALLDLPEHGYQSERARIMAAAYALHAAQLSTSTGESLARSRLSEQQAAEWSREWHAERLASERLRLTAPFDGRLVDVPPGLAIGTWVGADQALGRLVGHAENARSTWEGDALVRSSELQRIEAGQRVSFHPENSIHRYAGRVTRVESIRVDRLPHPMFDQRQGGPIEMRPNPLRGAPDTPRNAYVRVSFTLDEVGPGFPYRESRGTVVISAHPQSLVRSLLTPLAAALVGEASY